MTYLTVQMSKCSVIFWLTYINLTIILYIQHWLNFTIFTPQFVKKKNANYIIDPPRWPENLSTSLCVYQSAATLAHYWTHQLNIYVHIYDLSRRLWLWRFIIFGKPWKTYFFIDRSVLYWLLTSHPS